MQSAWLDTDQRARWRSESGHHSGESGSSLLEVPRGCRLPRHVDSAEETIVVLDGEAEIWVDGDRLRVGTGKPVVIPEQVSHEVRNAGGETLRFMAFYASPDVTTTYDAPVQPDNRRERSPI